MVHFSNQRFDPRITFLENGWTHRSA